MTLGDPTLAAAPNNRPERLSAVDAHAIERLAHRIRENIGRVIVGKDALIELIVCALLAEGHVLFEDVPGLGKTMLARTLARSLGGSFQRIQFTPDVLPSDVTGLSIFNQ